jgi:hypothetical protein
MAALVDLFERHRREDHSQRHWALSVLESATRRLFAERQA